MTTGVVVKGQSTYTFLCFTNCCSSLVFNAIYRTPMQKLKISNSLILLGNADYFPFTTPGMRGNLLFAKQKNM